MESIYVVVFLDANHYHVRCESRIVKKAVYIAIEIDPDGRKEVLGMWVGENENAKLWITVHNSLKKLRRTGYLITYTDNPTGFLAEINAVFPQTDVRNCIIPRLRNSSNIYLQGIKKLMADLKAVYASADEAVALSVLDEFEEIKEKIPADDGVLAGRLGKSEHVFQVPRSARWLIYTTNTIEDFNYQLRKVTKLKSLFPTDDSLLKMLYPAMMGIAKKWTGRRMDRSMIHAQLMIYYGDRMLE